MGSSKGKQQETNMLTQAQGAVAKVAEPSDESKRLTKNALAWDDWFNGPSPNIHDIPDQAAISLYNNAKQTHDAGRVGKGIGSFSDGANPNYAVALDKENELERGLAASGALENFVTGKRNALDAQLMGLSSASDARDSAAAGDYTSLYNAYLNRPQRPSFASQLALGLIGAGGQIGAAYMGHPPAV